jgi:hypothetical protein
LYEKSNGHDPSWTMQRKCSVLVRCTDIMLLDSDGQAAAEQYSTTAYADHDLMPGTLVPKVLTSVDAFRLAAII